MRAQSARRRRSTARRRPSAARRCSTRPASSTTTIRASARRPAPSGPQWRRDRGRLPALLRHAAARAGRSRRGRGIGTRRSPRPQPLDRQRLRHHRAGSVLRADAQIRVAADRARTIRRSQKLSKATFDVSEYIVDIARKEGLGARSVGRSTAASQCSSPATRGRRTWGRRRPRCCACCRRPMSP